MKMCNDEDSAICLSEGDLNFMLSCGYSGVWYGTLYELVAEWENEIVKIWYS